jgi:signal transduction histidine kinase
VRASLSLRTRFIIAAAVMIAVVIALSLSVSRTVLSNQVASNLDGHIDTQIDRLEAAITSDGIVDTAHLGLAPHFRNAPLQWGWRVDSETSHAADGAEFLPQNIDWQPTGAQGGYSGTGGSRAGVPMHMRRRDMVKHGRMWRIVVAAPQQLVVEAMGAALAPTEVALALMSLVLLVVAYLQLFYSLQPVFRLRDEVTAVRCGRLARLSGGQPRELAPFAAELNVLLDQNEAGLEHARHHVGNLAHGLKTPLATLTLKLAREGASRESRELVAQMARRIDHHLRRASSAARMSGERAMANLGDVARVLAGVLGHLHEDRQIAITLAPDMDIVVMVDPADLDEMLGNLLDNACRYAAKHVRVSAQMRGAQVAVMVEDDGPGIPPQAAARALLFGQRLDETGQGYGLGLGIVQELAQLYGGQLSLECSDFLGGLKAVMHLPCRI